MYSLSILQLYTAEQTNISTEGTTVLLKLKNIQSFFPLYLHIFLCAVLSSVDSSWELTITFTAQNFCSSGRWMKNSDWHLTLFMLYYQVQQPSNTLFNMNEKRLISKKKIKNKYQYQHKFILERRVLCDTFVTNT